MSKLIKCKSCGAEIAKTAKTCPQCGAKNAPGCLAKILAVVLSIALIAIVANILRGDDKPAIAPDGGISQNAPASDPDTFRVGDRVEMSDIYVTLVSVTESNGNSYLKPSDGNVFVICEFTIENESKDDLAVSSMMCFKAYADDFFTSLSIGGMAASEKSQLDGSIAAGKKMNGIVAYEVPADWSEFEIRYTPNVYSSKEFVFTYSK